jgi:hypothetical protein
MSGMRILGRDLALVLWIPVAAVALGAEARAQAMSGFVNADYGFGDDELPVANAAAQVLGPLVNESPPPSDPELPGVYTTQAAHIETSIGDGWIATAAGTETEVLGSGPLRSGSGAARAVYDEQLQVTSAALAAGTPVTARLRYRAAFGGETQHDLDPSVLLGSSTQFASVTLRLDALLGSSPPAVSNGTWYETTAAPSTIEGIYALPDALVELVKDTQVGAVLRLRFFMETSARSEVRIFMGGNPSAATGGTQAMVFGIESDTPGVEFVSALAGGPLPDFSDVDLADAHARVLPITVGTPVTVPEPAAIPLGATAVGLIARLRARQ